MQSPVAWEKGQVERQVSHVRRRLLVPRLRGGSLEEINARLEAFEEGRGALAPFRGPFESFRAVQASATSTCLVPFDGNQCSVHASAAGKAVEILVRPERIVGELPEAEIAHKKARPIAYQLAIAKLPSAKDLADFDFSASPADEALLRGMAEGGLLDGARNAVLVGGTGKSHLAAAVLRGCIRNGGRGRFFDTVNLVNLLEAETRDGRQGRLAEHLVRRDLVVLDELGYLPFARTGGQLLFHLLSRPVSARR